MRQETGLSLFLNLGNTMNKLFTRFAISTSLVLVLFMVTLNSGCAKDKPCKAVITVLDATTNAPISGATIHLTAPSTSSSVDLVTTTDATGKATYEVNLPQILDITVYHPNATVTGKVVRFEQGKTDEVTVKI